MAPQNGPFVIKLFFTIAAFACSAFAAAREINLVQNPGFESVSSEQRAPEHYSLEGASFWGRLGVTSIRFV